MTRGAAFHEDLDRTQEVKLGSERGFGFVFAVVFALVGAWPLTGDGPPRWWSLAVAGVFVALALAAPRALAPLNRLWFRFGLLLHRVINPLVMGLLFYVAVTPTGLIMRLLGKDLLGRRFDPEAETYWISREPPGPEPGSMKNQF